MKRTRLDQSHPRGMKIVETGQGNQGKGETRRRGDGETDTSLRQEARGEGLRADEQD